MTQTNPAEPSNRKPLRLWPGVLIVTLQWLARFVVPVFLPDAANLAILAGVFGGMAVLLWWLFFSRAPWSDRLGAIALMVGALFLTSRVVHQSIANGMMGMMLTIFAMPVLSLALVSWAAASRQLGNGPRRVSMVASILLACGVLTLVRTGGISGGGSSDLHWRWTQTPEERLLARAEDKPLALPLAQGVEAIKKGEVAAAAEAGVVVPIAAGAQSPTQKNGAPEASSPAAPSTGSIEADASPSWPGFRGAHRDGLVRGLAIKTDWANSPPVELWRRPIGPGWSSFAVQGDLIYTQEQRGDDELVSCYRLSTGEPVWRHADSARFWESNGGAGPRATPFLSAGRVYALGATGIVNALDADTGAVVWSRNAAIDTGATDPGWGFSGSPVVVGDVVVVAASGRLVGYETETGSPRWFGPKNGAGYSSPHPLTIDGVAQVLLVRGARTTSVAAKDGALLWEDQGQPAVSIVQPALAENGDILVAPGDSMGGAGIRRLAVAHKPSGWTVEERWTSRGLKPYFSDFVIHSGHAYGFDGSILACIDLATGERRWKGGRYGSGQLVLLPDQDLLLVLSEQGELALVGATPDQFTELARLKAIAGKTWNHPAVFGDVVLVRNGEEMVAFRLPLVPPVSRASPVSTTP